MLARISRRFFLAQPPPAPRAGCKHRVLNTKFKQCASATEVERLILETDGGEFNDENCAVAMRRLERRRSTSAGAVGKVLEITAQLPRVSPHCLSEMCRGIAFGDLPVNAAGRGIPAVLLDRISTANFHNVSPLHIAGLFACFVKLGQTNWPTSLSQTISNRTLFHDFTPADLSIILHALSLAPPSNTADSSLAKFVLSEECNLNAFSSKQLCETWQALERLQLADKARGKFVAQVTRRDLQDFNTHDLQTVANSTLLLEDNELRARFQHELASRAMPATNNHNKEIVVSTFYKFISVTDCLALKRKLERFCGEHEIRGTIFVASEGVNATICGEREDIDTFYRIFARELHLDASRGSADVKESLAVLPPFHKMMVRIKQEVVAMGLPNVDVNPISVGTYVKPADWDEFISQDDVVVIDTRNEYEIKLGTFARAMNPEILRFKQFPDWFTENQHRFADKRVAMFCTGGVRCEKSTAWAKQVLGGSDKGVFHLEGGILAYLQHKKEAAAAAGDDGGGKWHGDCFVFDDRIAVDAHVRQSSTVPNTFKAAASREVELKFKQ